MLSNPTAAVPSAPNILERPDYRPARPASLHRVGRRPHTGKVGRGRSGVQSTKRGVATGEKRQRSRSGDLARSHGLRKSQFRLESDRSLLVALIVCLALVGSVYLNWALQTPLRPRVTLFHSHSNTGVDFRAHS